MQAWGMETITQVKPQEVEPCCGKCQENFKSTGSELVGKLKSAVHEGNVRHITIRDSEGRTLAEFPLNVGIVGVVIAPVWAAIGALAALAADLDITVIKEPAEAKTS